MADETPADEPARRSDSLLAHPLSPVVDWVVAAVVALAGLALVVGGTALSFVVDRDMIVDGVESESIGAQPLTRAEMVDVADAVVTWTGRGLLLTGLLMVVVAIIYLVGQRRLGSGDSEDGNRYFLTSAVVGAVVTGLVSFVPFSPVVGGAVAGYLEAPESGRSVGAGGVSGFLAMASVMLIAASAIAGVFFGMLAIGRAGLAGVMLGVLFMVVIFVAAMGAGLGAIGGYVGARLAEE